MASLRFTVAIVGTCAVLMSEPTLSAGAAPGTGGAAGAAEAAHRAVPVGSRQAGGAIPRLSMSLGPGAPAKPDFSGVWKTYMEPGQKLLRFELHPKLPFTAEGKRRREEYEKLVGIQGEARVGDHRGAHCVPYGMPAMMEQGGYPDYPLEFIQRPDQLTIIFEILGETRRIYFGDRNLPPEKRLPSSQGYSSGHWEGDTLVVETTDLTDGQDQFSRPHSDQAKMLERFTLGRDAQGELVLSDSLTITDPVYYTEPVRVERKWTPIPDGHIMPFPCTEEAWDRLLDARREQLKAGKPITAKMKDVIEIYE